MRLQNVLSIAVALSLATACGTKTPSKKGGKGDGKPIVKVVQEDQPPKPGKDGKNRDRNTQADIDMGREVKKRGIRYLGVKDLDAPPVVVFVVLDTLRADHTSLCGYDRPTTPVLEAIVKERGAVHSCNAYSPAPWTHPSHATFFTGRSVVEHAAIWVTESAVKINPVTRVRPLDERYETVSELFDRAGYQTVAISGNMIVTRASGLLQGFDKTEVAKEALGLRGERFLRTFKKTMKDVKKDKPLFLFLNFYDAHDPYPAIPADAGWVPEQPIENLHPNQHDPKHDYYRYIKGMMEPEESAAFLERVTNGYDWGVHKADGGLGAVMGWMEEEGWLKRGLRLIVTSDHGEFLGEHQLLRHGGFLHEPVVNVPYVYLDTTAKTQPKLPEPFPTQSVFYMLVNGTLPQDLPPVHSVSESNEQDVLVGQLGGALWSGRDKLTCIGTETQAFNLDKDPGELTPGPTAGHPLADELDTLCGRVVEMSEIPPPKENSDEMIEALKAVGYMEDDE